MLHTTDYEVRKPTLESYVLKKKKKIVGAGATAQQ